MAKYKTEIRCHLYVFIQKYNLLYKILFYLKKTIVRKEND